MTKVDNADAKFEAGKPVHYCPGSIGGAEWNGPAYDPQNNLVLVGEVQWCSTATLETKAQMEATPTGRPWSGEASLNPYNLWGKQDPSSTGRAGSMRSTRIAANGAGAPKPIIRSRAA